MRLFDRCSSKAKEKSAVMQSLGRGVDLGRRIQEEVEVMGSDEGTRSSIV